MEHDLKCLECHSNQHNYFGDDHLTLKVLVTTIDALQHFETG